MPRDSSAYQNAVRDERDKDGGRQPGARTQVVSHGRMVLMSEPQGEGVLNLLRTIADERTQRTREREIRKSVSGGELKKRKRERVKRYNR